MKIMLVTNNYTPYCGGLVSSINALSATLQQEGHEVMLITLDFLGSKHADPSWVRRIPSVFRFRYKQNHMAIPFWSSYYIDQWLEEFAPDIVHVQHPFLLGPIAVECAKKRGIRTVFTYHTMYEQYAHYVPVPAAISRSIIAAKLRFFCSMVDHVVVPSRGIGDMVRSQGIANLSIIPSGLQSIFLGQPFNAKKLGLHCQLLYVGRLVQEKNLTFLLDVVASLPDEYQLTLVGYGAYTDYLKRYAYHELGLDPNRVRFIINPPKLELLNYYRNSHIFLFSSQTDTQGLVLAESMACSTPVIALNGIGQADIIKNGVNGFLVDDRQGMRQAIIDVCADPERYLNLQKSAHESARSYDPAHLIKKLIDVYSA